ncbi:hypothetical protein [Peribacillus frigoritolerans]|uniref:hypothetical protein n=1 Tax=Peribacillus frigoritolerans TaxID=450367 RepID=UPI00105943AC|nr:hypothetical protein [Peribacillus frigoritolerans]TDL79008.1 hypothetical protein E2R53_16335 [Peribacillus frigoritolerans]
MLLVWRFCPEVGLLAKMGVLLSGMALLLAKTGQILACLEEILSFFHEPPNWTQKNQPYLRLIPLM